MLSLLNLIRYKNLLFIIIIQLLIKYALFEPFDIDVSLSTFQYILLVLSTISIAAGGYIINDIYDVKTDTINKPGKRIIGKKITEQTAYNYYIACNVMGVGIGFYLANLIDRPGFAAIFIIISGLLYLYASYLKSIILVGNIVVAVLVAMTIIIVGIFDLYPAITTQNLQSLSTIFSILLDYAFFAFLLTFIREIVKDIEDINGDKNVAMQTLPILIGRKRAGLTVFVLTAATIAIVVYYIYTYMYTQQIAMLYFLLFVIAPLLYFCIKILTAEKQKDYHILSGILKLTMFFGMLSLLLYPFLLT
ncbi:MAG: geranylgeranylglycerol-phosphate geranylgeranyltransferase [Flavobacteriaceae bacterium]